MKKTTSTEALADAAATFIAENTQAPRAESKPRRKPSVKKGRRPKKAARKASPKKAGKVSAKAAPEKSRQRAKSNPAIPPVGSTIERVYKKEKIVVKVVEGGFRYAGETFTSLSALAKKITGYPSISGPEFFRLTAKDKPEAK